MTKHGSHIGGLDFIRFFAAVAVMLLHLAVVSWAAVGGLNYSLAYAPQYPALDFLRVGWVGVQTFFVLSGFVIARSASGSTAYKFLRGRAGRLIPAVWITAILTTTVILILNLKDRHTAFADLARTLFFEPRGPWVSGVFWTLQIEITFYGLIFALLLLGQLKHIEKAAHVLAVSSAIYLIGRAFFGLPAVSEHLLLEHGCFFALGIYVWAIFQYGNSLIRWLMVAVTIGAGIIQIEFLALGTLAGYDAVAAPLLWIASILAIWISATFPSRGNSVTRRLGLMTYPIYLVHPVIGSAILRVSPWVGNYAALATAIGARTG